MSECNAMYCHYSQNTVLTTALIQNLFTVQLFYVSSLDDLHKCFYLEIILAKNWHAGVREPLGEVNFG